MDDRARGIVRSVKPHHITRSDRIDEIDFDLGLPQALLDQEIGGPGLEEEQADWLLGDAYYGGYGDEGVEGGMGVGVGMSEEGYYYEEGADPTLLPGEVPQDCQDYSGLGDPRAALTGEDMDTSGMYPQPDPHARSRPGSAQGGQPAAAPAGAFAAGGGLSFTQTAEFFSSGPPPLMDVPMLEMASELPIGTHQEEEWEAYPPADSGIVAIGGAGGGEETPAVAAETGGGEGVAPPPPPERKKEPMRIDSGRVQISTQQLTVQLGDASALVRDLSGPSHPPKRRYRGSTAAPTPAVNVWLAPGQTYLLCFTPAIDRLTALSAQEALAASAPTPQGSPQQDGDLEAGASRDGGAMGAGAGALVAEDGGDQGASSPQVPPPPSEERFRSQQNRQSSLVGFALGTGEDTGGDPLDPTGGSSAPEGEMRSEGMRAEGLTGADRPPRLPSMAGDEPLPPGGGEAGLDFDLGLDVDALGEGGALPMQFGYGDGLERLAVEEGRGSMQGELPPGMAVYTGGEDDVLPPGEAPPPGTPADSPTEGGRYSLPSQPSQPMLVELMRSLRALPESGSVNLNREIMRGRPRREAAQLLFNALVLASHDRVTLAQERPYGELYMARGGMFV